MPVAGTGSRRYNADMNQIFYNDNDPYVAQWLKNLIAAGVLDGVVDGRNLEDLQPHEVAGYRRVHFFAGIGGWEYALRLAGWPAEWPVWTGSCPCQPFSVAGRMRGFADERHLWPVWFDLIRKCRPPIIFGEQVASKTGMAWIDLVFDDLEAIGYACGAANLPAACAGAPHIRQRIWFVALAHSDCKRLEKWPGFLEDPDQKFPSIERNGPLNPWREVIWLSCRDGRARPTEPSLRPLAHGVPARVGRLRAYGHAIVPQVAAWWIQVVMEYISEQLTGHSVHVE